MIDVIAGPAVAVAFYSMLWAREPHIAHVPMSERTCEALRRSNEWTDAVGRRNPGTRAPRFMSECLPPHMMQRK